MTKEKKKIIPKKTPVMEQDPMKRRSNFDEVSLGYSDDQAVDEAARCLNCKDPRCISGCPVHVPIPEFIMDIKKGDFRSAVDRIKSVNVLPAVCGRVCPQERQCEQLCTLGKKYEPVAIGRLERFAADWERGSGHVEVPGTEKPSGKKVAIIGSGPAGLTCAYDLARMGHKVTIFEALHEPGGVLVYGIPEFRLP
ncbi:MAG: NAD(P)-binding protein, partial [Nitrospirota bacterium]